MGLGDYVFYFNTVVLATGRRTKKYEFLFAKRFYQNQTEVDNSTHLLFPLSQPYLHCKLSDEYNELQSLQKTPR